MEASTLTYAGKQGLFSRPSPLLRLESDERLVALTRAGEPAAFETLVSRYQGRLLGFCRQMLRSTEDAEDVLQEVFVAAYNAMVADERPIAVKPWLYRIARNRSLNHLRRPTADGQDSMDFVAFQNGATTLEQVQNREEFRSLLSDVGRLPETQRTALLLREMDAMSYDEIAQAMDTTVPGVKSLLVRARIALAECSEARELSCDEVRVELAEAAEGIGRLGGPARRHVKACESCSSFRKQLRSDARALAAVLPLAPLALLKGKLLASLTGLFGGGTSAGAGAGACAGAAGGCGAAGGVTAAGGAISAAVGTVGTKAAVGVVTAALITAGAAVEIERHSDAAQSKGAEATKADAAAEPAPEVTPAPAVAEPTVVEPTVVEPAPSQAEDQPTGPVAEGSSEHVSVVVTTPEDESGEGGGSVEGPPAVPAVPVVPPANPHLPTTPPAAPAPAPAP